MRNKIVSTARKYIGTKFIHQGRCKDGLDCLGLIVLIAKELELSNFDFIHYEKRPDGKKVLSKVLNHYKEIPLWGAKQGDLLIFGNYKRPFHIAVKTDKGIIHVHEGVGKVIEHGLDNRWKKRVHKAIRFPGVN